MKQPPRISWNPTQSYPTVAVYGESGQLLGYYPEPVAEWITWSTRVDVADARDRHTRVGTVVRSGLQLLAGW